MKTNVECLVPVAAGPGDHEGRLMHRPPRSSHRSFYDSGGYKERWFKLVGNLLFYYRLNQDGGVGKDEPPMGVLVVEAAEVRRQQHTPSAGLFGLALAWKEDGGRPHLLFAASEGSRDAWLTRLALASYQCQSAHLLQLRLQLRRRTGKDPLEHELGRPQLFPTTSSYPPASSYTSAAVPCLGLHDSPTRGTSPVSRSRFYANTSWYGGSSPCLAMLPQQVEELLQGGGGSGGGLTPPPLPFMLGASSIPNIDTSEEHLFGSSSTKVVEAVEAVEAVDNNGNQSHSNLGRARPTFQSHVLPS